MTYFFLCFSFFFPLLPPSLPPFFLSSILFSVPQMQISEQLTLCSPSSQVKNPSRVFLKNFLCFSWTSKSSSPCVLTHTYLAFALDSVCALVKHLVFCACLYFKLFWVVLHCRCLFLFFTWHYVSKNCSCCCYFCYVSLFHSLYLLYFNWPFI